MGRDGERSRPPDGHTAHQPTGLDRAGALPPDSAPGSRRASCRRRRPTGSRRTTLRAHRQPCQARAGWPRRPGRQSGGVLQAPTAQARQSHRAQARGERDGPDGGRRRRPARMGARGVGEERDRRAAGTQRHHYSESGSGAGNGRDPGDRRWPGRLARYSPHAVRTGNYDQARGLGDRPRALTPRGGRRPSRRSDIGANREGSLLSDPRTAGPADT